MRLTTTSKTAIAIFVLTVGTTVFAAQLSLNPSVAKIISGKCSHVVDGDSLYLQGYKPQIRLWGVDAPERNKKGYQAAKDKLIALAKNKYLYCEKKDTDKYRRTVARCFLANAKDGKRSKQEINRLLIESGVVKEYCWFSKGFYGACG